jgi:hypothetical protein
MYYPLSQIKTNLFTNGGEYTLYTEDQEYKGYYYELSNGDKYTGKSPQDSPNILLKVFSPLVEATHDPQYQDNINQNLIQTYPITLNYNIISPNRIIPSSLTTIPTTQEQQVGAFTRYFSKKNNELKYMEINKETYTQLKSKDPKIAWDLYSAQLISWQIKGTKETVYKANKSSVALIEKNQKWYGFSQYFKDQFSKYYLES